VEEIELKTDKNQLIHNNKLASNIAQRELKILKIYNECALEVKCCLCSKMLAPKMFFKHECITNLVDCDESVHMDKSERNLRKISVKDTSSTSLDIKDGLLRSEKTGRIISLNIIFE